jgi:hypothetical protein
VGVGGWGWGGQKLGLSANRYKVSFLKAGNVPELMVTVAQHSKHVKIIELYTLNGEF